MRMMLLVFAIQMLARLVDCQGSLVMIGGNLREDNTEIWGRMVNLSAVEGEARIGVITAANSDPAYWAEYYVQLFMLHGAEAVWVPVTLEDPHSAYSQENVRIIQSCSGVFLGGGDPWRLVSALMEVSEEEGERRDTPVLAALKTLLEAGGLVAGTSAGIEVLSDSVIVTGGYSWEALAFGASVAANGSDSRNLTYDPLGGLGLIHNVLIDAHFRARARQGRLTRLLADTRTSQRAVGVDEDTALVCIVLEDVYQCEVVGSGGVWIVETPPNCEESDTDWSCREVITSFLTHNDLLTMTRDEWSLSFADWKDIVEGDGEGAPETSDDVFSTDILEEEEEYEYDMVVQSVLSVRTSQTCGRTRETGPRGYKLTFRKVPGKTEAAVRPPDAHQHLLSYKYLLLDFTVI